MLSIADHSAGDIISVTGGDYWLSKFLELPVLPQDYYLDYY